MAAGISLLLLLLLTIGMPVAFSLFTAGSIGLILVGGLDTLIGVITTTPLSTAGSYELISVPMFILMAEFVILSGVADNLFKAAATWVGRVPGGLAMATAIAGAGFGAISGSSTASAATLSSTTMPAMLKQGYEPKLAAGVVAISGTLAMLIPPSIALVLYGIVADVSIGQLLIGGVIPGILVMLTIVATVWVLVMLKPSSAPLGSAYTMREKFNSLKVVAPMVALFMCVTGVIYTGIATPTEASGLGAFGAFLLAVREGRVNGVALARALTHAAHASCMIIMIVVCAKVFGYFVTLTQATQAIVQWVGALDVSSWVVLAFILFGYLVLGCLMDQIAILILTVPIVLPLIKVLGFDPVWFGVIIVVVAEVGLITPPVGLNVFVVSRYAKRPLQEIFAGVWPHVFSHLLLIVVLAAFPSITLWLPAQMAP
ncbi:MAG: TRAP transporter large permease subunit [Rubrivivax sp.]|nr:TRAP transporter large permease subunit [Rubrivivax sp.]